MTGLFRNIFSAVIAVIMVSSCLDDSVRQEEKTSFGAVYSLNMVDSIPQIWYTASRIAVSGASEAFNATGKTTPDKAEFAGKVVPAESYYALSPYSAFRHFSPSGTAEVSAELPVVQTAVREAIPREANIAVASCKDADRLLTFNHLMTFIKFTIGPDSGKIRTVSAVSTDGSRISGDFSVDCSDPYHVVYPSAGSYSNAVLEAPGKYLEEGDYYMALFPITSGSYVELAFEDVDGRVAMAPRSCVLGRIAGVVSDYGTVEDLEFKEWAVRPVGSTKMNYPSSAQTIELQYLARIDADAYVQHGQEWISIVMTKGVERNTMLISLKENTGDIRVGQIIVESADGKSRILYTFTQQGRPSLFEDRYRAALIDLYDSTGGDKWYRNDNWCSDLPLKDWYGVHTDASGAFTGLSLGNNNLTGSLPDSFADLSSTGVINLYGNSLGGNIPSFIYGFRYLDLSDNEFTSIDDVKGDPSLSPIQSLDISGNKIEGRLPESIGYLPMLELLNMSDNQFSGNIPDSYGSLVISNFLLNGNMLTGKIPLSMQNNEKFAVYWPMVISQNGDGLDLEGVDLIINDFSCYDAEGNYCYSSDIFAENELTLVYTWSDDDEEFREKFALWYEAYHDDGFEVIMTKSRSKDFPYIYASSTGWYKYFEKPSYAVLADSEGRIIVNPMTDKRESIFKVIVERLGYKGLSEEDYHDDGDVCVLQKASEGNGIDVVITGEAYSAETIKSGKFAEDASKVAEYFFDIEPFRSYRHLFNVYSVTAVSDDDGIEIGNDTKFDCEIIGDSKLRGNDEKCFEYALKAVSPERLDETLVIVLVNTSYYSGTSYLYPPVSGDFGNGKAVCYLSAGGTDYLVERLVHHEAAGHGFAKLADEYMDSRLEVPSETKDEYHRNEQYGWWRNCDFTDNPSKVKWSHFIRDERYSSVVGVYEGSLGYSKGAFRPTASSIMKNNIGTFNPPSREAIWYRIHKLAYGSSWKYSFEDFADYDSVNR